MNAAPRARFEPSLANTTAIGSSIPALSSLEASEKYIPLITCPANFPRDLFEVAISQLVHHPEYNSTLILRSETISDLSIDPEELQSENFVVKIPHFDDLYPTRCIHRKLLPRRPARDSSLEQYCTLYTSFGLAGSSFHSCEVETTSPTADMLILTPITSSELPLPYYHPRVHHLAFRYLKDPSLINETGILRIEVLPLPDVESPLDPNGRLYRTCLALLETLHRYGWGAMTNYQKRVHHDVLISRERYQDLYLVMRERHKGLVETWKEVTDPLKHVFEDIGIATYLMLLWKDTYKEGPDKEDDERYDNGSEPWHRWPQAPGGFLDLGCGNGLLTHILVAEGYDGIGIDVRARTSWSAYPESTQKSLHVRAFDALSEFTEDAHSEIFRKDIFIIANHADELTPWTPVLATLCAASGYLSIPCCAWTFDARYSRSKADVFPLPEGRYESMENFVKALALGGDGSNSSGYSMYRIWLASLSLHCGWEVECETLRIPSTRNWALIGRKYASEVSRVVALEHVKEIIDTVKRRGVFKPRKPEGKEDGH